MAILLKCLCLRVAARRFRAPLEEEQPLFDHLPCQRPKVCPRVAASKIRVTLANSGFLWCGGSYSWIIFLVTGHTLQIRFTNVNSGHSTEINVRTVFYRFFVPDPIVLGY